MNATLNATSAALLLVGYALIRKRKIAPHRGVMILACIVSLVFLASYVYYHSQVGSVRFQGQGWIRPLYYTILLSHTILAIAIVPLVIITLRRALRGDYLRHSRLARLTFPLWLYVSTTGVVVYWMLYRLD